MKTTDASSNRPVQSTGTDKSSQTEKKPKKEFDKVLDDHKGQKKTTSGKEKPFSPLTKYAAGGKKSLGDKKDHLEAHTEAKADKLGTASTEQRDYSRIEARGEKEKGEHDFLKKESSAELQAAALQAQSLQPQTNVQQASAVQAAQRPGLNINEIQSIVNKV
jgi:hypothetical protein